MVLFFSRAGSQPTHDILSALQHTAQRIVDFMGHPGGQSAHREHFLRLYHGVLQAHPGRDVIDPDDGAFQGLDVQGIDHDIGIVDLISDRVGDLFRLANRSLADGLFDHAAQRLQLRIYMLQVLVAGLLAGHPGGLFSLAIPLGHPAPPIDPHEH